MRQSGIATAGRALAAFAAAVVVATAGFGAAAQDIKQMQLADKQVEAFIAAQKDFAPLASKLLEGGEKPDQSLTAELEAVAKKHGFASFAEYEDVGANISIVLEGLDRKSGVYTDPVDKMKKELEDIKADSSIPDDDKKLAIDDLNQEIAAAQPLQFKDNIDVVKKHREEIEKLIPEEGELPAEGGPALAPEGAGEAPPEGAPEGAPAP
ncbi:MAG: hypothetical protein ACT4N2_12905 [Hyphomicrobium sp.]